MKPIKDATNSPTVRRALDGEGWGDPPFSAAHDDRRSIMVPEQPIGWRRNDPGPAGHTLDRGQITGIIGDSASGTWSRICGDDPETGDRPSAEDLAGRRRVAVPEGTPRAAVEINTRRAIDRVNERITNQGSAVAANQTRALAERQALRRDLDELGGAIGADLNDHQKRIAALGSQAADAEHRVARVEAAVAGLAETMKRIAAALR